MSYDENAPVPEPRGDLVPPARHPPIAVGSGTPSSEPHRTAVVRIEKQDQLQVLALLGHAVTLALDVLDAAGDAVAVRLGIRQVAGEPPTTSPPPT
jgi:hypothetical protein